jgi:uncharacterized membrane protein (DUF106 family)
MNEVDLGVAALLGIALASVVIGAIALLSIRFWSDQNQIARAKNQAQAHLLEVRLFMEDPRQVIRSQRALIVDNLRILRLLLRPLLLLAIPMALAVWQLDALYGRAPLRIGEPVVVSAESRQSAIVVPDGLMVETPPIYTQATAETNWRVRPLRATSGNVRVASLERRMVAGSGIAYLPEPLLGRNGIEIAYPHTTVLGLHWLVWFLVLSPIAGFILRRPLRVAL